MKANSLKEKVLFTIDNFKRFFLCGYMSLMEKATFLSKIIIIINGPYSLEIAYECIDFCFSKRNVIFYYMKLNSNECLQLKI